VNKLKRSTSHLLGGHWKSVKDIPLESWIKCLDGQFNYVNKRVCSTYGKKDIERWLRIYNNYILERGLTEIHLKHLNLMKKKALLQIDFILTHERFKLTLIEIEEARLKSMLANSGNGMSIEQALVHIGKWMGERIRIKEITAFEYFVLLDEFSRANK